MDKKRHAARKAGKRQLPYPHEHALMSPHVDPKDPDNDGDIDTPGQPDAEDPGTL